MLADIRSLGAVVCWVVAAYMVWYVVANALVRRLSKGHSLFGLGLRGWLSGTVVAVALVLLGVRLWTG